MHWLRPIVVLVVGVCVVVVSPAMVRGFCPDSIEDCRGDSPYDSADAIYRDISDARRPGDEQEKRSRYIDTYNQGNAAYRQGKYAYAVKFYEMALELEPDNPDALHNLESARTALANHPEAAYGKAVEQGNAAYEQGDYAQAIELYEEAYQLLPYPYLLGNLRRAREALHEEAEQLE